MKRLCPKCNNYSMDDDGWCVFCCVYGLSSVETDIEPKATAYMTDTEIIDALEKLWDSKSNGHHIMGRWFPNVAGTFRDSVVHCFKTEEKELPLEGSDRLLHMFDLQAELNRRIGNDLTKLDSEEKKIKWILNVTLALRQEASELVDSVPWKWWAKYQKFDEQNAKVEVVDMFHFLISLAQILGLSGDDVYQTYIKKNKVNVERQVSGYTEKTDDNKGI